MPGQHQFIAKRDVELTWTAWDELKLLETFCLKTRLHTNGPVYVASRLAVVDANFHAQILSDGRRLRKGLLRNRAKDNHLRTGQPPIDSQGAA